MSLKENPHTKCKEGGILLRKAQYVIGLNVVNVNTGRKLGVVKDLLFDDDWVLRGVVLEPRGLLRRGQFIPSEKILAFGEDALTVSEDRVISSFDASLPYHSILNGDEKIKGKVVITTNGLELGLVEDVYFQEEVGTIIGYELTDGFLSDIIDGRKYLPKPNHFKLGSDALVVPQEMESKLMSKIEE